MPAAPNLSTCVIRGVFWTGSPFFIQIFIGLLFYTWLPTDQMGNFEWALVIVMLLALLASLGLGEALVQNRQATDRHFSTAFWTCLIVGVGIALAVTFASPMSARYLAPDNVEQFSAILETLILLVPFAAVSGVFRARLQRDLRFRAMAVSEVAGIVVYAAVAIALLPSRGIMSPVISAVAREIALFLGLWFSSAWLPRLVFSAGDLREIIGFGLHFTGSRCVNYINSNMPRFIIFPVLGATANGYFNFAYRLTLLPLTRMSTVVTRVFFPTFATIQEDDARLRSGYLRTVQSIALFGWPLLGGLFVFTPEVISLVRHVKEIDMAPAQTTLRLLVLATLLKAVGTAVGSMFLAKGRANWSLYWSLFSLVVLVPALMWGVSRGVDGVAAVIAATALLFLVISQHLTNRLIQLRFSSYLAALVRPALVAAFVFGLLWLAKPLLPPEPVAVALVAALSVLVSYALALRLFAAQLCRELWATVRGSQAAPADEYALD